MRIETKMNLQNFYPKDLEVANIIEEPDKTTIKMFTRSKSCKCPKCGSVSEHGHGTYERKIQDLPVFGKRTVLLVNAYEYQCDNPDCSVSTFVENMEGFLDYYSRMTGRCADFICSLAMETSCEGCARICRQMNIKTSGDSVIRLLMRRYKQQEPSVCGEKVGVDDFAFKKRNRYGTVIVDADTHKPVAVLEGRDGDALKEWLKQNKHIKVVTRDRAGAYASAILEALPEAMQVADRFHLHQNLLEVINKVLGREIPDTVAVPKKQEGEVQAPSCGCMEDGKKNAAC